MFPPALKARLSDGEETTIRAERKAPKFADAWMTVEGHLIDALDELPDLAVDVVAPERGRIEAQVLHLSAGSRVHLIPAPPGTGMSAGWVPRALVVRRYLRSQVGPDIVHGIRTDYGHATMAVSSGFPHVITIEGFLRDSPRAKRHSILLGLGARAERKAIRHAQNIVAISQHVQDRIASEATGRIFRIPNMVADEFFLTPPSEKEPVVVYVGRISPEKGLLDFLRVARKLDDGRAPSARWLVIGDASGHEGDEYLRRCKESAAGLSNQRVDFLGWVPNVSLPGILGSASCAVFPYRAEYETFALSVAEAMASGVSPIVYDFGPLPELVEDRECGFVVTPGDLDSVARHVRELLENPALASAVGASARAAAQRFRKTRVALDLADMYRTILASPKPNSDS